MNPSFQSPPHALHVLIGFHLDLGLSPFNTIMNVTWNEVAEKKRISSLGSIIWVYTNQEAVYDIGLVELDSLDEMPPTEWEQASHSTFLQGVG